MKLKRIMAIVLCFAMVLSTMGIVVFAETTQADVWDGTVDTTWYDAEAPQKEYTLTTAEQFAGLAYLVNGAQTYSPAIGNNETADFGYYCGADNKTPKIAAPATNAACVDFDGVTIKLASDLDMRAVYENGDHVLLPGNEYLTMMPIGYSVYTPFKGTFDGQGHTISNIFQGMWDALGHPSSSYAKDVNLGVFGYVYDAVIKNLVVDNISFNAETIVGGVAGRVGGTSTFDVITIKNSTIATGGGWYVGGLIGWANGNQTIKNISIDETNTIAQTGGHVDTATGGIVGGCNNVDGESITFVNCDVACKLDVYNDCTANYDTKSYRNCGMVIGALGEGVEDDSYEKEIDGKLYPDFERKGLTFENVKVTFGEWANYTYCWSYDFERNCKRIEPGVGYGGVDLSQVSDYSVDTSRPFDAIFGAENAGNLNNVRGRIDLDILNTLGTEIGLDKKDFEVVDNAAHARNAVHLYTPATTFAVENINGYIFVDSFETLQDALAAAEDGDMLLLVADVVMDSPAVVEKDITLDLNGKTLSYTTDEAASVSLITNRATLTIKDETGAGKITMLATNPDTNSVPAYASNTITNYGTLNVTGGTIENATDASGRAAYAIDNNSSVSDAIVNITGGSVTGVRAIRQFATSTTNKNEVNIENGEVVGSSYGIWTQNPGSGDPSASLNISGGTVSKIYLSPSAEFDISISDGNLSEIVVWDADTTNTDRNPTGFITGGTFTQAPADDFVADGFEVTDNNNGSYGIDSTPVAVGTYEDLVALFTNGTRAPVKAILTADITGNAAESSGYGKAGIVLQAGDVLDGDNFKLTITDANATWDCAIAVKGGTVKNLTIAGAMRGAFMPGANGDVVIDNCVFEDVIYTFNSDAGSANYSVTIKDTELNGWTSFSNVHGAVKFDGCTFGEGSGYAFLRPYQATTFVNCEFNEGYEFDTSKAPANSYEFDGCTYDGEALSAENGWEMFYNGGDVIVDNAPINYSVHIAHIGSTPFTSLQDAVDAANAGDTIVLAANIALDKTVKVANGKTITLDLNKKTITGTDKNTSGNFYLIDNRGNLTITGEGTITLTAQTNRAWNASSVVVANNPGGKLVIESGNIQHLGGTDMAYAIDNLTNGKNTYAETVVNGGVVKSTYRAVRQFLNGVEAQNILTVNGGTIEGTNKAIWFQDPSKNANSGTLTVTENAAVNGDIYLTVTAGSTEWPVTVSIAASAVNGEVLTSNVPLGLDVVENNGVYGVVRISPDVYTVTAIASKEEVRYNNANTADTFTVDYIVTGGNVIGAMAQFEYDNTLFTCAEDSDNDGVVRMNSYSLTTDSEGKTLLKTLTFTVAKNPDVTTTYTFKAKHVQVVSDFDAAGSGAQDGFVSNLVGADVTVIAQYDVTLPADGSVTGDILVDSGADYTATIAGFEAERVYTVKYTMGGTEYTVNVDTATFVIEDVTGDIEFISIESVADVEIVLLADVINGLTLVMVKNGAAAGYTYDGATMYEIERYEGLTSVERTDFVGNILDATTVHAIFVEGAVTVDEAKAAIKATNVSASITKDYDVNRNGQFYFNDAMTAYGCYYEQYDLDARMTWFLSADVNTDFYIDVDDYDETVAAFWATLG